MSPDFKEFLRLLKDEGVRYRVVGGYAVAAHGHPRYTKDLDIWLEMERQNAERLLRALNSFGMGTWD